MAQAGKAILVRAVEYAVTDRGDAPPYRVITSILDWQEMISGDVAAAYHHRWEIEISFDEIETHQVGHLRVLRSKTPEMVRQEIWGILLANYAIWALIVKAAHDADIDPDRLSFLNPLRVIRREADGSADFPPHRIGDPQARVADEILAHRLKRRNRSYPRVIKRYGPCYRPIKRPWHKQTKHDTSGTTEIRAA